MLEEDMLGFGDFSRLTSTEMLRLDRSTNHGHTIQQSSPILAKYLKLNNLFL